MKDFRLLNTNRFLLPGTNNRFLHLGSIQLNLREFICFVDRFTQQFYIEEVTGGHGPDLIEDNNLWNDLCFFAEEKGIINPANPSIPDSEWLASPTGKKIYEIK